VAAVVSPEALEQVERILQEADGADCAGDLQIPVLAVSRSVVEDIEELTECAGPSDEVCKAAHDALEHKYVPVGAPDRTRQVPTIFRGALTQAAHNCVLQMEEPFIGHELIERMKNSGYKFASHPEVSIHIALKKMLEAKVIEVVEQGGGRRPNVYRRRR
jgi:hypothetical protein